MYISHECNLINSNHSVLLLIMTKILIYELLTFNNVKYRVAFLLRKCTVESSLII